MNERLNNEELKGKIEQYLDGQLSPREVDELWAELVEKGEYLDYMKSVANLKSVVEEKKEEKDQVQEAKRSYIYYAAAAVIALLIVVLGVMNLSNQESGGLISPIPDVELEYYRSADGTVTDRNSDELIRDAVALANNGEIEKAISLLEEEIDKVEETEQIARLNMTLGSLFYNQEQYDNAIERYGWIIERADKEKLGLLLREKALWYRGNAYLQKDQVAEAKTDIKEAYELNGAYRRVAERYLKSFDNKTTTTR